MIVSVLLALLFLVVMFCVVKIAAGFFGLPEPIVQIIGLIMGLMFLLYALGEFGVTPANWRFR